jgi:hypothetical protein
MTFMKWTNLALFAAALGVAAALCTGCGSSGAESTESEAVSSAVSEASSVAETKPTEPATLPFSLPEGFTYNESYSTVDTALYSNDSGIAITVETGTSSPSNLLAAQTNVATEETTLAVVEAERSNVTDLALSDFEAASGQGYMAYRYTLTFTYRSVSEIDYRYDYTTDSATYLVSVNAAQSQWETAQTIADSIVSSMKG